MLGKREANKARKRAAIVEVATSSFFEHGYAATSMTAIAESIGCSKATLWGYFNAKEDLFDAVVESLVKAFSHDIDEVLVRQTLTRASLRRACVRFLECLLTEPSISLFRLLLSEGDRFPEMRNTFYARGPLKIRAYFTDFLATRIEAEEARLLAHVVVSAITGYRADILLRPEWPSVEEREAFVDRILERVSFPPLDD